jgi:2-oxoglutarate ferredoxin oxidoreductase subunit gamma
MGNARLFNTMILGGYLKVKPIVSIENVKEGLAHSLPERLHKLIPANEAAIKIGMDIVEEVR